MIDSTPRFLNGAFAFTGAGYGAAALLHPSLVYTVPSDRRAQLIYLRAGNSSEELIYLAIVQDSKPVRMFPVGAKAGTHVPLAVVEDLQPDTRIEVFVGAPAGMQGTAIVDLGLIEI
jgi:hypothetical protein